MPKFQSFWFGEYLPPYQLLAMKSFVDFGHEYVLYSYRKFDVPAGVELRDGNDILPEACVFFYGERAEGGRGSISAFSNVFRYHLLHQMGGWWVDADVVCLSEIVPSSEIFMGWEYEDLIGTAILKFPEGHRFIRELRDTAERSGTDLEWGATGPFLLTRLVGERNLLDLVSPQRLSYPVQSKDAVHLLIPGRRDEIRQRIGNSSFLHIWNEVLRRAVVFTWMAPPPASFIAELFERHRIGFGNAPAYTADQVQRLNDNYCTTVRWDWERKHILLRKSELAAEKAEFDQLRAELTHSKSEGDQLGAALSQEHAENERLRAELSQRIAVYDATLATISWRVTAPLRWLWRFPRVARYCRAMLRIAWWSVTFQLVHRLRVPPSNILDGETTRPNFKPPDIAALKLPAPPSRPLVSTPIPVYNQLDFTLRLAEFDGVAAERRESNLASGAAGNGDSSQDQSPRLVLHREPVRAGNRIRHKLKPRLKRALGPSLSADLSRLLAIVRNYTHRRRYNSAPASNEHSLDAYKETYLTHAQYAMGALLPSYAPPILKPPPTERCDVKFIAYYLPQFHPIPENDEWWGKGFTEWRNVTRAFPVFRGHDQPRLPGELGYYDLRVPEVMRRQVELAKLGGISAFCFHFYWFGGKRLLELPLENFLQDKDLDLKFCLCWANENWTRRWDGAEKEILIAQSHSAEDDVAFIRYLKKYFDDPRYLRIEGKPALSIYRPEILPDARATVRRWRTEAEAMGFPGIYLIATNSFDFSRYQKFGFDALSEFPPHGIRWLKDNNATSLHPDFQGGVFSYSGAVNEILASEPPLRKVLPGVMPGWDNTPRRLLRGNCFSGSTPTLFYAWLIHSIARARRNGKEERLVFINAWNEWAEGACLEPDRKTGYAYLAACAAAISDSADDHPISRHGRRGEPIPLSIDEEEAFQSFPTVAALVNADEDGQCKIVDGAVQRASHISPRWISTAGGSCRPEWWCSDPEISLSAIRIFRIREAYYWPRLGVVATSRGIIPWSPWACASYVLAEPSGLPYVTKGELPTLNAPDDAPLLEKMIVTMSWGAIHNYGHFVLDCLSGVFAAQSVDLIAIGYTLGFPQLSSWQRRHFDLLGRLPLCELDKDLYRVSELIFPSCVNAFLHWPNLVYRLVSQVQKARIASETNSRHKIYISRKHNPKRHFLSEERLEEALANTGFRIIVPEEHSIDEQIKLFDGADVVVGCSGAAFANTLYCRPGAKVVEIQPTISDDSWIRYNCWWTRNICAIMALDWHPYFCVVQDSNPQIHGGKERTELGMAFDANIDDFMKFLRKVM